MAPAGVLLWTGGTLAHVLLSAAWASRLSGSRTRDERLFLFALLLTGGLVVAVHASRAVGGLGVASGLMMLAAWHLCAGLMSRGTTPAPAPIEASGPAATFAERSLEAAALLVLGGISLTWIVDAAAARTVSGTDAAHYHVPVAANIALGAGLFHLTPTPHLYPMAASSLVAWFILPTRDALLIDAAMLPPFLLLVASMAYSFRLVTGRSGLAWMAWPALALFGTRLFRASSLVSADLLFAAALCALVGNLLFLLKGGSRALGLPLAGLSTGLLVGSKFTGIPAALLLWAAAIALRWLTGQRPLAADRRQSAAALVLAGVLAVGAGGIWLIHNWILWGSPIAPTGLTVAGIEVFSGAAHAPTDYLSVLGDRQRNPAYPLGKRLAHYIRVWLGMWYLLGLLPIVVLVFEAMFPLARSPARDMRRSVLVLVVASAVPIAWLLVGAPWTSLEWTKGFSLRYVLPYWALLVLLTVAGCFPAALPWYERGRNAAIGAVVAVAVGLVVFIGGSRAGSDPPRVAAWSLMVAGALWLIGAGIRRAPARVLIATAAGLALSVAAAAGLSRRHDALLQREPAQRSEHPVRALLTAAEANEHARARACAERRFFLITRVDEPLELQPPGKYRNLVFYAAREVDVTSRVDPMGPCDYIVASRLVLDTDKGRQLVAAINRTGRTIEIGDVGAFVLIGYE
jgi:hypothetical protein